MRRKQLSPEPVEGSFTEGFKIQNGWRFEIRKLAEVENASRAREPKGGLGALRAFGSALLISIPIRTRLRIGLTNS
jgi:hypothetical protein